MLQTGLREHMKNVCQAHGKAMSPTIYRSSNSLYSQGIRPTAFLVAEDPPSIVCINNKVASTTWEALFVKLYKDHKLWQEMNKTGQFYLYDHLVIKNITDIEFYKSSFVYIVLKSQKAAE